MATKTKSTARKKKSIPAASKLVRKRGSSTAKRLATLRDDYGLSQTLVVRLSGYSPRSITSWSNGTKASKPAETKFTELCRLFEALVEITESKDDTVVWLQEPNDAFDGSTPLQVIERGESDRIWRMVYFLRSGSPS